MIILLLVILGVVVIFGAIFQYLPSMMPAETVGLARVILGVIFLIILIVLLLKLLAIGGVALP
jgi:hypothetical protein